MTSEQAHPERVSIGQASRGRIWPAWCIALALGASMLSGLHDTSHLNLVAGGLYWLALAGLWPNVSERGRHQTKWIIAASLPGLLAGLWFGTAMPWHGILTAHTGMLSMLVAVGFVAMRAETHGELPVNGLRGKLATFANVHLIGAVINYSAVIIFGDRLARGRHLTLEQALLLSRAFAAAGFWSPFFATTATALAYAPSARILPLLCAGLALSVLALLLSLRDTGTSFQGVGLSLEGLQRPAIMVSAVAILHGIRPGWSIPSIITIICPVLACLTWRPHRTLPAALLRHVNVRLPSMATELALFLSAGLLSVSLTAWLNMISQTWSLSAFGPTQGSIALLATLAAALVGIHPLISISLVARLAHTTSFHADVLAFTIVASWAIGSAAGPLSGQNLGIQARYGVDGRALMRSNLSHAAWLSLGAVVCLHLLS